MLPLPLCLLPQSVFNPKEDVKRAFVSSHMLLFCAPRRTIWQCVPQSLISVRSAPFDRFHSLQCLFFCSAQQLLPSRSAKVPSAASDTIMISGTSRLLLSASASPLQRRHVTNFASRSKEGRRAIFQIFPEIVFGTLVSLFAFFFHLFFFPFRHT